MEEGKGGGEQSGLEFYFEYYVVFLKNVGVNVL